MIRLVALCQMAKTDVRDILSLLENPDEYGLDLTHAELARRYDAMGLPVAWEVAKHL